MNKFGKVAIVGQGYVGLPIAVAAANAGFKVIGFDLNNDLVYNLSHGKSHVEDITSQALSKLIANQSYMATSNANDFADAQIVVIAVPTPLDANKNPDLRMVESAAEIIGKTLNSSALIINESTSYPGTLRNIIAPKVLQNAPESLKHEFAISPERVDPGNSKWGISNTPRLYSGLTTRAKEMTREFYSTFCENLIELSEPEVAEAAKLFENTFRLINISLVNELSIALGKMGIGTREVLSAAATKPYGFMKFEPSVGIGGHCIPVDPSYLFESARLAGHDFQFISLANSINHNMAKHVTDRLSKYFKDGISGKKILVAGVAYKSNIGDTRETPVENLVYSLRSQGAKVNWHDPLVDSWLGENSIEVDSQTWDLIVVATAHDIFLNKDFAAYSNHLFDCTGKINGADQL